MSENTYREFDKKGSEFTPKQESYEPTKEDIDNFSEILAPLLPGNLEDNPTCTYVAYYKELKKGKSPQGPRITINEENANKERVIIVTMGTKTVVFGTGNLDVRTVFPSDDAHIFPGWCNSVISSLERAKKLGVLNWQIVARNLYA